MGNCVPNVSKSTISKIGKKQQYKQMEQSALKSNPASKQQNGIVNNVSEKILIFNHSRLIDNDYLHNKFHHDKNRPDELNLEWQIKSLQLHNKALKIGIINLVKVRVWLVIGGKEKKNLTGLYLCIEKYIFAQSISVSQVCKQNEAIVYEIPVPCQINTSQTVKIIVESVSDPKQSLYLVNTYRFLKQCQSFKIQRQQLMWSSLAFQLQNIYNQTQETYNQKLKKSEEYQNCVICHGQPSSCILLPCRHMCIGKNCINGFKKLYKTCPLCKKDYHEIIVYREVKL